MNPQAINVKAQPWKAFLSVSQDTPVEHVFDTTQALDGPIRLRIEADDKGGLGG